VDDIAAHIRAVRADSAAWSFPERGGRWSLGGQQGKFALCQANDGSWLLPSGRAASTHIVKVGVEGVAHSDVAEYVTMRAAEALGLPVPQVQFVELGSAPALVTTRFDRLIDDAGVHRVHQEDLCQALGLWRTAKYQADGGPSASDVVAFLRRELDPRDRQKGVEDFARALVFNWITAGTDAHAKNYAVLLVGTRVVLAPFYDLMSTALLWPDDEIHFKGRLAMKLGGYYRLRKVDAGRLGALGGELGVDPEFLVDAATRYRDHVLDAARDTLGEVAGLVEPGLAGTMVDRLAARLRWVGAG
jgi:serine/threonine-protein kinase HipA